MIGNTSFCTATVLGRETMMLRSSLSNATGLSVFKVTSRTSALFWLVMAYTLTWKYPSAWNHASGSSMLIQQIPENECGVHSPPWTAAAVTSLCPAVKGTSWRDTSEPLTATVLRETSRTCKAAVTTLWSTQYSSLCTTPTIDAAV